MNDAEARTQRRGDQSGAGGRSNEREVAERKRMNARTGPLANDKVDAKILHRRIKNFFHGRLQTVDFIEKENFFLFERCEDGGEVALAFEQRPGAGFDRNVELVGDDLRERGLAQARRTIKQHVIERLIAAARGVNRNLDVFLDPLLPDVLLEPTRAHADLDPCVFFVRRAGNNPLGLSFDHPFCARIRQLLLNKESTEDAEGQKLAWRLRANSGAAWCCLPIPSLESYPETFRACSSH